MKKQTLTKIISGLIILVFVVSISQFALPMQAADFAQTGVLSDLYSNPNQNGGKNPYKFALTSVLKSGIIQQVIGCTGVVNKVATWMSTMIQSPEQIAKIAKDEITKYRNLAKQACLTIKAGAQIAAGTTPVVNDLPTGLTTAMQAVDMASSSIDTANSMGTMPTITVTGIKTTPTDTTKLAGTNSAETAGLSSTEKTCVDNVNVMSDAIVTQLADIKKQQQVDSSKTQCFDGIAITLAKNQLTAMTRSAMNWVNSGYGGNPFFVQSMTNLTKNIEYRVVETGTDILLNKAFGNPYAHDFALSAVNSYNSGSSLNSVATNFLGSLTSDLSNFITDPTFYYTNKQLTALERSQRANDAFANDFSTGGWNAWLALTQRDANNPLGFAMQASQYLADQQAAQIQGVNNELLQNNGFLSQKTCLSWYMIDSETGEWVYENVTDPTGELGTYERKMTTKNPTKEEIADPNACAESKIVTPGSIIKDKITNTLNSPERQLELAKTINDSLNALFSVLISKLEGGGLSGLSDNVTNTSNYTDYMNNSSLDGNTPYNNNGAYDGFNLTRDLGNTYIHATPILLGTWNAKACPPLPGDQTNCNTTIKKTPDPTKLDTDYPPKDEANKKIKLYPDSAPEVYQVPVDGTKGKTELLNNLYGDLVNPINGYYKVTTAGNTKLITEGYNGWAIGDRAFWDGSSWQNWKIKQSNPIKQRGVIQIQNDYIVAAQEILKVLPKVMINLGELDYCIPGPNPNYKINSMDAQSAYQSWAGSMYVGPIDQFRTRWTMDHETDSTYKTMASMFSNQPNVWNSIIKSSSLWLLHHFGRDTGTTSVHECVSRNSPAPFDGADDCQNYHYSSNGDFTDTDNNKSQTHINDRKNLMEVSLNYTNSSLFQNFYDTFDQMMDKIYFNKMTSKYINTETSIDTIPNLAYVDMAASGLDLTKNISYYNDDTTKAIAGYTDAIAQAKINIAKLAPIETEVGAIIKVAQGRRDAELLKQINKEGGTTKDRTDICKSYLASCGSSTECKTTYNACIGSSGKDLTIDLYKKIYASCLAEENIQVFDPEALTSGTNKTTENCTDGIDNDLNGLVDCSDSACSSDPVVCPYVDPTNTNSGGRSTPGGGSGFRR